MKIAFVIGHNSKDKGAHSDFLNISEWDMWSFFYHNHLKDLGDVFFHNLSRSYTQRQTAMSKKTAEYDLVFELHFNASLPQANGVEALVYFSNSKTKKLGELYCDLMSSKLGLKNRGCKKVTKGNGFGFLKLTKGDAILLEPFFGSNTTDCQKYNHSVHAEVIKQVIDLHSKDFN